MKKYSVGNCHKCGHKEIIPHDEQYIKNPKYCTQCGARVQYSIEHHENLKTGWDVAIRRYHRNNSPIR